ncbi:MAG TPA: aldehyde dehydrogenase family protein [Candidatus Sphingobacterium stercorigallinarum]|nr:aldehyde dehydrogenase family protein [Candidatus Sphingobacterium stercorigallinarum]
MLKADIDRIYRAQVAYKETVKHTSVKNRQSWLRILLSHITAAERSIEYALYTDFHKSSTETAVTELLAVRWELRNIIKSLPKWMRDKRLPRTMKMPNVRAYLHYEPKGNSLIITPWNYPFLLPLVHLAASVAAGNTVILKLSEHSPKTNEIIRKIVSEVFPEEHVAIVEGDSSSSTHLLKLKFDHIHFTGSQEVGKIVAKAAAEHLCEVTLELGGKSPAIVDRNVNLKRVVKNLIWAKFINAGQTCIASDYLLVHRHLRQEIETTFKTEIENAFGKNPLHSPDYARLINIAQFDRLDNVLQEAIVSGANVISGGQRDRHLKYIAPTVLSNVSKNSDLLQKEIFGPILPIVYYGHIQEAIDYINARPKPLALYIFSNDPLFGRHILRHTTAGSTCINDAMIQIMHPHLPFGGVNHSGTGKSLGHYGYKSFSHERAVAEAQIHPLSSIFWYPYTERTNTVLQWLNKLF